MFIRYITFMNVKLLIRYNTIVKVSAISIFLNTISFVLCWEIFNPKARNSSCISIGSTLINFLALKQKSNIIYKYYFHGHDFFSWDLKIVKLNPEHININYTSQAFEKKYSNSYFFMWYAIIFIYYISRLLC